MVTMEGGANLPATNPQGAEFALRTSLLPLVLGGAPAPAGR